jgi:broad specificity phosphatase PhoE
MWENQTMIYPLWVFPPTVPPRAVAVSSPLEQHQQALSLSPVPAGFAQVDAVDGSIKAQGPSLVRRRLENNGVRLVLIRHGQAQSNADSEKLGGPLLYGQSESLLTAKGIDQAKACAVDFYRQMGGDAWMQQCLSEPNKLPVLLASTVSRATDTANILAGYLKDRAQALGGDAGAARVAPELIVRPDARLLETNFGRFEKRPFSELQQAYPDFVNNWRPSQGMGTDFLHRFPGGESRADTMTRVANLLDGAAQTYSGRTVVCVTHGETAVAARTVLGLAPVKDGKILADTGVTENAKPYFLVGQPTIP